MIEDHEVPPFEVFQSLAEANDVISYICSSKVEYQKELLMAIMARVRSCYRDTPEKVDFIRLGNFVHKIHEATGIPIFTKIEDMGYFYYVFYAIHMLNHEVPYPWTLVEDTLQLVGQDHIHCVFVSHIRLGILSQNDIPKVYSDWYDAFNEVYGDQLDGIVKDQ